MRALLLLLGLSLAIVAVESLNADVLGKAIHDRLSLMRAVGAYKWHNKLPIENLAREKVVIQSATLAGLAHGITTQSSKQFFQAQIEAAKDIQQCWFNRWQAGATPPPPIDLNETLRPELIALGNRITAALTHEDQRPLKDTVLINCLSDDALVGIQKALSNIQTYPNRMSQIRHSGLLRVGTTGDYAPFSFSEDNKSFSGY